MEWKPTQKKTRPGIKKLLVKYAFDDVDSSRSAPGPDEATNPENQESTPGRILDIVRQFSTVLAEAKCARS